MLFSSFCKLLLTPCFFFSLSEALVTRFPNGRVHSGVRRTRERPTLTPAIVTEFPRGTWLENLVIRQSDGNALVTVLSAPEVYLISTDNSFKPVLVASFPGNLGCLGIVELGHNVFYVATGNWSVYTDQSTPGTYSVWQIDMRNVEPHHAKTSKIADLPQAGFLNGMAVLNPYRGTLLVADSLYSAVWSVNVHTGEVGVAINDTSMAPISVPIAQLGINSLHVLGDNLYFANTDQTTFNRVPINLLTGAATGPVVPLLRSNLSSIGPDDFIIDFRGNVLMTADLLSELDFLPGAATPGVSSTRSEIVAGSRYDQKIAGWTAAQLGTKAEEVKRGRLFVTTNGGPLNYPAHNWTSGGQLISLDTVDLGIY